LRAPQAEGDQALRTEHLSADLTARSARGGTVTIAVQFVKTGLQFGTIAILGRLLDPASFGLIAMVATILTFLEFFKDLGLSAATVQRTEINHAQVSALFWINVGLGIVAAAVTAALAPAIAWFYGQPKLTVITLWLSIGFLVSGLTTQHLAILRRQMRFGALAVIQLVAEAGGMAAAVAAAFAGAGYWSLVIQRLVWISLMAAGAWLHCRWRPGLIKRGVEIRGMIGFGGNITASNLVNFLARNLDQVLIGWYWGASPLGLYERATKLTLVPITNINTPLFTVLMPTLSRLVDDPARYRRVYLRTLEKIVMLTMPCAALLIATPEAVVRLLFGPKWLAAAPIVAWLGVAMLYQPATYTSSWLFTSQDRTRDMLRWGLLGSTLTALSFFVALPFGATAVAASFSISGLLVRLPILFWLVGRRGPVRTADIYRTLAPSALAALLVFAATRGIQHLATMELLAPALKLGLSGLLAALVAAGCFFGIPRSRRAIWELGRLHGVLSGRSTGG
jgi:O-antigen/teichoic acid export membrane protein